MRLTNSTLTESPLMTQDHRPHRSWCRRPNNNTLPVLGPPCDSRGGADAPARRLRAALMSQHQGSMVLALILTHRRYRAATAAPRPHGREAKGADAPARRLRADLMSQHQGPTVQRLKFKGKQQNRGSELPRLVVCAVDGPRGLGSRINPVRRPRLPQQPSRRLRRLLRRPVLQRPDQRL